MQQPTDTTDTKSLKEFTPEVTWAQRSSETEAEKNHVYLTIAVPDVDPKKIKLDLQPTFLDFTGYSQTKKANYHVKLEFYEEIDPAASQIHHSARDIEMVLRKKELKEEYWPRLLKEKVKYHFLKTNFDKWVDQDEQEEAVDDDYMSRMGGMPGGGMGGGGMPGGMDMESMMASMGGGGAGMGGDGGFGGIDFSKLGGMGGGMNMGDMGDEGDDDEDEDMPELENEKAGSSSASAGASKIEEVE